MPRSATTGVFTRVSNSFSQPVFGTLIDPTDADAYFDDLDVGLNPPELDGPVRIIDTLQVGTTGTASGTIGFFNATSGSITLSPPIGALGTVTLTLPAATDTLVGKATTDTLTNKTLTNPAINGATILTSTYNKITITAPATSATLTLIDGTTVTGPATTDTLVGKATTDTLTNKTLASTTDVIGGVTMTLGSDANGDIYYRNSSGVLTRLAPGGTSTYLQGSATVPSWVSALTLAGTLSAPQVTVLTSGTAQTYNTPANTKYLTVEMAGGGGGGAGSGTTPGAAGAGVASSFAGGAITLTANGGAAGSTAGGTFVAGGTATGGDFNYTGGSGGGADAAVQRGGGSGGQNGLFAGGGAPYVGLPAAPIAGNAAITNSGGGGAGASAGASTAGGGSGGGAGGSLRKLITSPNATFTYTVGGGGAGGTLGTTGAAGGAGAAGIIIVTAHFQ